LVLTPEERAGLSFTDGGEIKLLAYLRGFTSVTKEMITGRRVGVLTDTLLHYAQRQIN